MTGGLPVLRHLFPLADFIAEIKLSASLEAQVKECVLNVSEVDPKLAIDVDRDLLLAAVGNLLQNAFKFTHPHSEASLHAYALADRILIDVQDHCGGLGLSIARRSVEADNGILGVRNLPGTGCVFTIDLPRHSMIEATPLLPQAA
jgi:hypothetical protein